MQFPYDLAIVPLGIYPREMKTYVHAQTHARMFIALFIITKHWKQPRYPSTDEQSDTLHPHMEYYLAVKKDKRHGTAWMNFWKIMLRLHTTRLFLYDFLEMTQLEKWRTDQSSPMLKSLSGWVGVVQKQSDGSLW